MKTLAALLLAGSLLSTPAKAQMFYGGPCGFACGFAQGMEIRRHAEDRQARLRQQRYNDETLALQREHLEILREQLRQERAAKKLK